MHTDRDTTRIVRSWLEEGRTALPDSVLDAVLDQVPATRQRRSRWPAWRFADMNGFAKILIAAAVVAVVAIVGINLVSRTEQVGTPAPAPSPSPSPAASPSPPASPEALHDGLLQAGTYVTVPFYDTGSAVCLIPPQDGCTDSTNDDHIRVTFTVPDGWEGAGATGIWLSGPGNGAPDGAGLLLGRGAWLLTDPCQNGRDPDIRVGPTVDDFVGAVAAHPILDTTTPVAVELAGYSGKYFDLQTPADISGCDVYRPWEPGIYAQGPAQRWHLWVLDVDGTRVVVQSSDYAATSAQHVAELDAIVKSIEIEP